MKKLILATAVVALFTACHSTTESDVQAADSAVLKASVDTVAKLADSAKVDSLKVIDTIKK